MLDQIVTITNRPTVVDTVENLLYRSWHLNTVRYLCYLILEVTYFPVVKIYMTTDVTNPS